MMNSVAYIEEGYEEEVIPSEEGSLYDIRLTPVGRSGAKRLSVSIEELQGSYLGVKGDIPPPAAPLKVSKAYEEHWPHTKRNGVVEMEQENVILRKLILKSGLEHDIANKLPTYDEIRFMKDVLYIFNDCTWLSSYLALEKFGWDQEGFNEIAAQMHFMKLILKNITKKYDITGCHGTLFTLSGNISICTNEIHAKSSEVKSHPKELLQSTHGALQQKELTEIHMEDLHAKTNSYALALLFNIPFFLLSSRPQNDQVQNFISELSKISKLSADLDKSVHEWANKALNEMIFKLFSNDFAPKNSNKNKYSNGIGALAQRGYVCVHTQSESLYPKDIAQQVSKFVMWMLRNKKTASKNVFLKKVTASTINIQRDLFKVLKISKKDIEVFEDKIVEYNNKEFNSILDNLESKEAMLYFEPPITRDGINTNGNSLVFTEQMVQYAAFVLYIMQTKKEIKLNENTNYLEKVIALKGKVQGIKMVSDFLCYNGTKGLTYQSSILRHYYNPIYATLRLPYMLVKSISLIVCKGISVPLNFLYKKFNKAEAKHFEKVLYYQVRASFLNMYDEIRDNAVGILKCSAVICSTVIFGVLGYYLHEKFGDAIAQNFVAVSYYKEIQYCKGTVIPKLYYAIKYSVDGPISKRDLIVSSLTMASMLGFFVSVYFMHKAYYNYRAERFLCKESPKQHITYVYGFSISLIGLLQIGAICIGDEVLRPLQDQLNIMPLFRSANTNVAMEAVALVSISACVISIACFSICTKYYKHLNKVASVQELYPRLLEVKENEQEKTSDSESSYEGNYGYR